MSIYSVYQPPLRGQDASADPERFAFVREGFHVWAMLFAPLWLLTYRLWLALLGYVVLTVVLTIGLHLLTGSDDVVSVAALLIALLMGFEASTLRRWTLERNGWRHLGSVVGDDLESAERRFFESWIADGMAAPTETPPPAASAPPAAAMRMPASDDVIGLFPGTAR